MAVGGNETYAIFLYADGLMQWTYDHDTTGFNFPAKRAFSIHYFPLAGDYVSVTFMTNVNCPGMSVFQLDFDQFFEYFHGNHFLSLLPHFLISILEVCDQVNAPKNPPRCDKEYSLLQQSPSYYCVYRLEHKHRAQA